MPSRKRWAPRRFTNGNRIFWEEGGAEETERKGKASYSWEQETSSVGDHRSNFGHDARQGWIGSSTCDCRKNCCSHNHLYESNLIEKDPGLGR